MGSPPVPRNFPWRRVFSRIVAAGIFGALIFALVRTSSSLSWSRLFAHPALLFACVLLYATNPAVGMLMWSCFLNRGERRVALRRAYFLYAAASLSRYLPGGSVWQLVLMHNLAEDPSMRLRSVTAQFLATLCGYAAGTFIAVAGLHVILPSVSPIWSVLGVAGMLFGIWLLGHRRVTEGLSSLLARRFPSLKLAPVPRRFFLGVTVLSAIGAWMVEAAVAVLLLGILDGPGAWSDYLYVLCGYSAAAIGGYLTFLTPSGSGVREGVFAFFLKQHFPVAEAVFVSLAMRALSVLADLLFSLPLAVAYASGKWRPKSYATAET